MTDVCVVALGKIGLPLAATIADAGHRVRGADIDPTVVDVAEDLVDVAYIDLLERRSD